MFCIVNASTREPVTDPVQRVIERGEVVGLANHTMLLAKDGQEYQIADSAAPVSYTHLDVYKRQPPLSWHSRAMRRRSAS